ncbi:hypothetical protein niasHT_023605 [Heterodera trifolii]|uniref:Uncharacterized protein n=1 Tax=Heterodera trifolii TaxID=157864 RepID=A0ABD2JK54_9BILA
MAPSLYQWKKDHNNNNNKIGGGGGGDQNTRNGGQYQKLQKMLSLQQRKMRFRLVASVATRLLFSDNDDSLLQAWHELVALQAKQSAIAHRDHPVDERLLTPLRKCGGGAALSSRHGTTPWDPNDDVNSYNDANNDDHAGNLVPIYAASSLASTLAPQRVEIYAEIGHLTQFCGHEKHLMAKRTTIDIQQMAEEFRNKCSVRSPSPSSLSSSPSVSSNFVGSSLSLAQFFTVMGARVETVVISADDNASKSAGGANANRKHLQEWTRQMVDKVRRTVRAHSERWKLVLIAPGLHDIPYGQSSAVLAQDVLQSVQLIRHGLPRRTFLLVLRQSNLTFWRSVAKAAAFCSKMLSLWEFGKADDDERAWDLLEARLRTVYGDDEEFHVQIVDLMEHARPVISAGNYADLSPLASDCVHLSPRGLSLLHLQLWNWLVQPRLRHSQPFVPLLRPPLCPRPHCPFLATPRNIISCPRVPPDRANQIAFSSSPLRRLLRSVQLSTAGKVLLLILFALLPLLLIIVLLYQFVAKANNNINNNNNFNSICCCPRRRRSGGFSSSPSGGDSRRRAKGFRQTNRRFIAATP